MLLAHLSGFYYALQWPLERKAALLAGMGAFMMLALGAMQAWAAHGHSSEKSAVPASPHPRGVLAQRIALALGVLLVLGLTQRDVMQKETVIAQGQRIYIALQPLHDNARAFARDQNIVVLQDSDLAGLLAKAKSSPSA